MRSIFLYKASCDVVTVPNLSEHLISAETTEQLSARFDVQVKTRGGKHALASA